MPKNDGQDMIGVRCHGASGEPRTPWTASATDQTTLRSQHGTENMALDSIHEQFSRKINIRFLPTKLKLVDLYEEESGFASENCFLLEAKIKLDQS